MIEESAIIIENSDKIEIKTVENSNKTRVLFYLIFGVLILIAQLILSGYAVLVVIFIKKEKYNIFIFVFFRGLISSCVTLIMAYFIEGPLIFPAKPFHLELSYFTIVGFMVHFLVAILYLKAVVLTSASYCAIYTQIIPIFTVILFYVFKIEKLKSIFERKTIFQIFGTCIGFSFALAILVLEFKEFEKDQTTINLVISTILAILNNIIFAMQLVIQTKLFYKNPSSILKSRPFTAQAYTVSFGFLFYTLMVIPYFGIYYNEFRLLRKNILVPILYASIIMCPISYGLMAYCNKMISPVLVGASFSLGTITSLSLLNLLSDEKLQEIQYFLFPGVILGVIIVVFAPLLQRNSKNLA